MDSPAVVYAGRWLIRDTFCQALTSRVFWLMLGTSAVCILFCLSVSVEGPRTLRPEGESELYGPDHQPSNCQMLWTVAASGGFGLLHPIDKPDPGDDLRQQR